MKKEIFKEYSDIKNKIKLLTDKAKSIEVQVKNEMEEQNVDQVKSDFGIFSFIKRKKWTYSENVAKKENEFKELKKQEESDGTATFEEIKGLMYRGK